MDDESSFVVIIAVVVIEALIVAFFTYDAVSTRERSFEKYQQQFSIAEQKCDDGVDNFTVNQKYECEDGTSIDLSGIKDEDDE